MRGLKYRERKIYESLAYVAPFTGAWIEIAEEATGNLFARILVRDEPSGGIQLINIQEQKSVVGAYRKTV